MEFLKQRWITISISLIGALAGYIYWQQIGCASGTCIIQSQWYTSSGYGLLMGYLIGDSINSAIKRTKKNKPNE